MISDTAKHIGEKVKVSGWVNVRRAHGKILFIDLRDISGLMQVVFVPSNKEVYDLAQTLRPEWVVEIVGQVVKRPENMVNPEMETGQVVCNRQLLLSGGSYRPGRRTDMGSDVPENT